MFALEHTKGRSDRAVNLNIVAIVWRIEYSRNTTFLNLLPDSRLR